MGGESHANFKTPEAGAFNSPRRPAERFCYLSVVDNLLCGSIIHSRFLLSLRPPMLSSFDSLIRLRHITVNK